MAMLFEFEYVFVIIEELHDEASSGIHFLDIQVALQHQTSLLLANAVELIRQTNPPITTLRVNNHTPMITIQENVGLLRFCNLPFFHR